MLFSIGIMTNYHISLYPVFFMNLPNKTSSITAESPCIGHCTTVLGDEVCRSCLRTFEEIVRWPTINDTERIRINQRIYDAYFAKHDV